MNSTKLMVWCQLFSLMFVGIFFGQNLGAGFWFIDDHEIIAALTKFGSGASFWSVLMDSEVGQWGFNQRFRPSYYFLRYLEVKAWGDVTFYWYFVRLLIFQQFLGLSFYFAWRSLGPILGIIFSIWLSSLLSWYDIFARLGPGETYLVLSAGLLLASWLLYEKSRVRLASFLAFAAIFIGIGSKENMAAYFLIIGIPIFWVIRRSWRLLAAHFILYLSSFFIVLGVFKGVGRIGIDVVGKNTDVFSRFLNLLSGLGRIEIQLSIVAMLYLTYLYRREVRRFQLPRLWLVSFWMLMFILLNSAFYSGSWPTNMRYDFPGLWLVGALVGLALRQLTQWPGFGQRQAIAMFTLLGIGLATSAFSNFQRTWLATQENLERTNQTEDFMQRLRQTDLDRRPKYLVYEVLDPMQDFEHYFSVKIFSEYYGIKTPIVSRVHVSESSFSGKTLEQNLLKRLQADSVSDSDLQNCVSITYKVVPPKACEVLELVWK